MGNSKEIETLPDRRGDNSHFSFSVPIFKGALICVKRSYRDEGGKGEVEEEREGGKESISHVTFSKSTFPSPSVPFRNDLILYFVH